LGGQGKILGEKVVKSDKCIGVSQLSGARARDAPKVYAYGGLEAIVCFYFFYKNAFFEDFFNFLNVFYF